MFLGAPAVAGFLNVVSQVFARCGALASRAMRLVVLLVACLVAAGCTAAVEGTPSAPTGVLLPPRPREVRLDGVDPCSLLSAEQWVELGFEGLPARSDPTVELFRGVVPTCTLTSFEPKSIAIGVGLVTTTGIERWQDRDLAANVTPAVVAGFPAVVARPTRSASYCSADVDVAAGQLVDVQVLDGGGQQPVPQDMLCARATQSADMLLKALLQR